MGDILQIIGIAMVAVVLLVVLREQRPEIATQLSMAVAALLFFLVLGRLKVVIDLLELLAVQAQIEVIYLTTLIKVVGIAYLTEFSSQICADAGENAVGSKIELAGKVIIVVLSLPIIRAILETVLSLLP